MTEFASQHLQKPSEDMPRLHCVLMMIAVDIDLFCEQHDITYYLMGGTALGAMRHNGFIPWDDDFDIFMDRANYLRFIAACNQHLDRNKYYLQREDTEEWPLFFSKIRLNDTQYVEREEDLKRMHSGIYIDVMCLHNAFSNPVMRRMQFFAARILSAIALAGRGYETGSFKKRSALFLGRIFSKTPIKFLLLWFVRALDGKETEMVGHFFGRAPFAKTSFPRRLLGVPRKVKFEAETLPVPDSVEEYLNIRFGLNHMQLPDQKTRDAYPTHLKYCDFGPY